MSGSFDDGARTPAIDLDPIDVGPDERLSTDALLAEVPGASVGEHNAANYLRLTVATTAPVAVGVPEGPARYRLERAGWPVVSDDADREAARDAFWPCRDAVRTAGLDVRGSLAPAVVFVMDNERRGVHLPGFGPGGRWLLDAVRALNYDELVVLVTNSRIEGEPQPDRLRALARAVRRYEPAWVALGEEAAAVLRKGRVPHVTAPSAYSAWRWRRADGPEGYAARLRSAGLEEGPWRTERVPTVPSDVAPPLVDALRIPRNVTYVRRGPSSPVATSRGSVRRSKVNAARTSYVLGYVVDEKRRPVLDDDGKRIPVQSLADVARCLKIDVAVIREVARAEEWQAERERVMTRDREKTYERVGDAAARGCERAVSTSWDCLNLALDSLRIRMAAGLGDEEAKASLERLELEPLAPSATHAEALGRLTLALSSATFPGDDDAAKALRDVPLVDQYKAALDLTVAHYGPRVLRDLGLEDAAEGAPAPPDDA